MILRNLRLKWRLLVCSLIFGLLWAVPTTAFASPSNTNASLSSQDEDPQPKSKKKRSKSKKPRHKKSKKSKKSAKSKKDDKPRWGRRHKESNEKYDKRYARVLKRVRFDKEGDTEGGNIRLWTYKGYPFIVRSDISAEFTADTAMYMEQLHREYSKAYAKMLGIPAEIREKIEVVVYKDRTTYMKAGGMAGSGGSFSVATRFSDRGDKWPALRFRLTQFTDGIDDFAKWEKGVLKHESAHMEFQMRLGLKVAGRGQPAVPIQAPLWFNEGQAMIFEDWDFDLTVDENFDVLHKRGRYAPVIRRMFDTELWKDFNYIWTIDPNTWASQMTSRQGFLNYAQAWSLAAYMMNSGRQGRHDFRAIFDLSKRIGGEKIMSGEGSRAWDAEFPAQMRGQIDKNWRAWVKEKLPKGQSNPGDDIYLLRQGYRPEITDRLVPFTDEEMDEARRRLYGEATTQPADEEGQKEGPTSAGKPRLGKERKGFGETESDDEDQPKTDDEESTEEQTSGSRRERPRS